MNFKGKKMCIRQNGS